MNWRDEKGKRVGQKLRKPGKNFSWIGEGNDLLYGMWLWGKGKSITITEGEIDAMSMSQAFDLKWPVVSLPNGSNSVKKTIKRCYDYLCNFDRIVLMFDMDDPGRKAVEEAALLLPAGKVFIANLPEKDANEVLKKHGPAKLVECFWNATPYRPDGIVSGADLSLETLKNAATKGYEIRYPDLQERLLGMRKGEITLFTAASGIGKSTMLRQLTYELHEDHKLTFGNIFLEENNIKTAQAYIAIHNSVPLGKLRHDPSIITDDQWREGYDKVIKERMWFYNHFGSLESNRLISKLHYMATVLKVDFICLDHISIVTSGLESSSEGERKDIDILMTRLRSLVEETGVGVLGVVHLKRVKDKNFNEGDGVSLTDLRGSASLEQLSDNVISLERNQQDEKNKNVSLVRVLKCRETGDTGASDKLLYVRDTGRMVLAEAAKEFTPKIMEAF
jgi:twinkle protein